MPSTVEPSLKVTLPTGVPEAGGAVTIAVRVTGCPNTDGLGEQSIVVRVPATCWFKAGEVEPVKYVLPA
jgi:hypothetical protein